MSDEPILEFKPEVIIKGELFEVISKTEDEHGVVWVEIEPSDCRVYRIILRRTAGNGGKHGRNQQG
jgi:hypothetical protein